MPRARRSTVMITGASRGLGRALAEAFAGAGSRLVLCARGRKALEALARELEAEGAEVEWAALDVTDEAAVRELVTRSEARFGVVDVLVNNASILGHRGTLADQPVDEWRSVLDVNLTGALVAIRAVLPGMRATGGGSIINVSSGVGDRPRPGWGAYAVSKAALEALTWNLAVEERETGVRANAVDPGAMRTDMRRSAYPAEDPDSLPDPAEITPVFLWLASEESASVSGERFRAPEWP
ncbi:MAG: SDR family oxidoreductase [Gemmatimonadetes bacterium]|nr:SDR family oxidoreductase [Gemmatimonadota bacterium]